MGVKVAFITGAGSGMGQHYALKMMRSGWMVAAIDVNQVGLDLLPDSQKILRLNVDITDFNAVKAAARQVESELGPINRVVNAAGIMPLSKILNQDVGLIKKIMDINYGGLVNVAQATLPGMLERKSGEFVSFASLAGHLPVFYVGAYNASKFAVIAFTEVLYQENKNCGVKFACVCPPPVQTPLLNQARETVWPKLFGMLPAISPESVIDKIDRALINEKFWVFPGPVTKLIWYFRRYFPGLAWRFVRSYEGL
ncbi:SDR family NAD(P)-dependent oxidoreductase [Zhongshania sp.]|uniref:SDR family NAD(P)-dependent oxidoreductase n=1 Tax=Zhongshania sp. TaxID=1971902 RepID=UPI0035669CD6